MMECIHKPIIKINQLMNKRARYTCRHCGAEIEMTPTFSGISRSLSMVLIMLMLLKVMGNNTSFGLTGTAKLLVDLGMMLGIVLVYLVTMLILTRFGKFQEIQPAPAQKAEQTPEEDTCEHTPKVSWKIYLPGQFSFTCDRCGQPITLPPAFVKKINMILMLTSFAILIPFFADFNIEFWIFGLLTLLVLLIGVALQFYVIRKGRFIKKP
jgi:hypothetical protein